ncbi:hypothetical protein EDB81DRAFT_79382 [Dactylonectria macrodidyma]|uniref:Uncharacterized protein n=1 Tax=Dactylonectria macrodidyma TaxID=307937 RepID=A0A9P9EEL5_9HYPO|nr:hypothetical protein EDB81DRAFT_79382 [Dactylonectria macrodidyma]
MRPKAARGSFFSVCRLPAASCRPPASTPMNSCQLLGKCQLAHGPQVPYKISLRPPSFACFLLSSSYLPCEELCPRSRMGEFSVEGLHCTSWCRSSLHCPSGPWVVQFLIYTSFIVDCRLSVAMKKDRASETHLDAPKPWQTLRKPGRTEPRRIGSYGR